jgi:hypothetical protein
MITEPDRDGAYIAGSAYATMMHYATGSNYYVNPRQPHFNNDWQRVQVP